MCDCGGGGGGGQWSLPKIRLLVIAHFHMSDKVTSLDLY